MRYSLRTLAALSLIVIGIATLLGCGSGHHQQPVNLFAISVSGTTSAPLQRGQTLQLTATGSYTDGTRRTLTNVTWTSADKTVATVSSTGLVTAVSRGTTDISAAVNLVSSKSSVSVKGLAGGTIGSAGGVIKVNIPGNASDGATITVPGDATAGSIDVHIELDDQDALPGALPTGVNQASKVYLLTKDATYNFTKPLDITIPVDHVALTNNEFPVVFYWSTTDNKYRPTPITAIDATNNTVTFKTDHFSTFVALAVPTLATIAQTLSIDSGFRPNVDGFFHPNFGSYDSAGGACLGMAMFSEWYFSSMKKTDGADLFKKYLEGDVASWQDDATARELIEHSFESTKNIWSLYSNAATADEGLTPAQTALATWIALAVTNEPQTLLVRFANGQGHAVTVYNWDYATATFGIYDSNFPGDNTVRLGWSAANGFTGYTKAGAYPVIQSFTFLPIGVAVEGPELKTIYDGAETGWDKKKFDQISFTAPAPDTNGNIVIDGNQALTVTGTVLSAGKPTHAVYSWNGTRIGVAPITNGAFTFTIPATKVVGYANTIAVTTTTDPKNVWIIGGYADITTHIKGAIFFNNPGFETGDFTGWTHETHTWSNRVPGSFTPEKSIIATAGTDPLDPGLSTVYAGTFSARVNNDDNDLHISSVSQTVIVPQGSSPQIRFYWAAVLEDPGHSPQDQPYVDIKVTDDTAGTTLYSKHFYSNDPTYSGWVTVYPASYYDAWQVIRWQPVVVAVPGAAGHHITVRIEAADCALSGHGGYAYFDGDVQ
jgi:Bacterial Ig-like domain (group 2)